MLLAPQTRTASAAANLLLPSMSYMPLAPPLSLDKRWWQQSCRRADAGELRLSMPSPARRGGSSRQALVAAKTTGAALALRISAKIINQHFCTATS